MGTIKFIKNSIVLNDINNSFTNLKNTFDLIYIRDPRKIVTIYANHSEIDDFE